MDIDALWTSPSDDDNENSTTSNSELEKRSTVGPGGVSSLKQRRSALVRRASFTAREIPSSLSSNPNRSSHRRSSFIPAAREASTDIEKAVQAAIAAEEEAEKPTKTLILPTGVRHYSEKSWLEPDIKKIRHAYVANGIIFPKYQEGLKSYYAKDHEHAKKCFEFVLTQRDDGPSRYFLGLIAEHGGALPRNFIGYTIEREY